MSFFSAHEKANKFAFRAFNVASDALLAVRPQIRKEIRGNRNYQGIHKDQRCFILGTGPSLAGISPEEVSSLKEEFTFAVNSFYRVENFSSLAPTYYVLADNSYWGKLSFTYSAILRKYSQSPPIFITDVRAKNYVPGEARRLLVYAKNYPVDRMRSNLSGNLSITMNVVGLALISAIYMGFREIYLLGCDYNLFASRSNMHSYDDSDEVAMLRSYNLAFYLKEYHITTTFHYLIARLAAENGIRIVNATNGSLLDAYPHRDLQSILVSGAQSQ
ncbi:hypothetical protein [Pararhodobacter sp.]|uniref:hypothetical protein n=1 Tax=Pararhodobacter sp. TaxID=2127056 RepID=UPI002AFDF9C2|nr:hypothetical protein [Pararhodobacter sp.]